MYAEYSEDGRITSVLFGNINLKHKTRPYLCVPGNVKLDQNSRIDTQRKEFLYVVMGNMDSYQITEATSLESFPLEVL